MNKTVREWLPDYYAMCEGNNGLDRVLSGIWDAEVESAGEALRLVNGRIDRWIAWLSGVRPSPLAGQI